MIVIEKQGHVLTIKDLSLSVLSPPKPAKRGKVTRFTNASRRRMIDLAARLDVRGTNAKFLTLTFSGYPTPAQAKIVFTKFLKRLHRRHSHASALWRAEMQQRGSPHFHLIVFHMPYVRQAILQKMWEGCTGETTPAKYYRRITVLGSKQHILRGRVRRWVKCSRLDIRKLGNHRAVMSYVSKYCAKRPLLDNGSYLTDFEMEWTGRHWGVFNRACFPLAPREVAIVRGDEIPQWFRKLVYAASDGKYGYSPLGVKLYTSYAKRLYERVTKESTLALVTDALEPDNRYMASRATRKRIQAWFGIAP